MEDQILYQQLEKLGAVFPWDRVDIWITREPEGVYKFTAYVADNYETGAKAVFGHGATPEEAVDQCAEQADAHNPEIAREKKIAELELELQKLRSRPITRGLCPYRAPNQIGFGIPRYQQPPPPETINVESTTEAA